MKSMHRSAYLMMCTCLFLLLLMLAGCGNETPDQPAQRTPAEKVDQQLSALASIKQFSGTVLLAQNEKVALKKAYGQSNFDNNQPNSASTQFLIGSLTQEFTATAILQLQDQNKLKLQDSACTYLAGCPGTWQAITIDNLLSDTAGLKGVSDAPKFSSIDQSTQTPTSLIDLLKPLDVAGKPGAAIDGNGSDYILLSAIIEKVSGESYRNYIKQQVLENAGLQNTDFATGTASGLATGYASPGIPAGDAANLSVFAASQGLYSTIEDLQKWDQALQSHTVISQASFELLMQPHGPTICPTTGSDGKVTACPDSGYQDYKELKQGYGRQVGTLTNGQTIVTNIGKGNGFYAAHSYLPAKGITVLVLSNIQETPSDINGLAVDTMLGMQVS